MTTHRAPTSTPPPLAPASRSAAGPARVPLDHPPSLLGRLVSAYSRRTYGADLEPGLAMLHNPRVLVSTAVFELGVQRWSALPQSLTDLATAAVASQVGCSWCLDFGYYLAHDRGLTLDRLEQLPTWRDGTAFTELERTVLAYAEAMTTTPPTVTDELVEQLRSELTDAQLVELTAVISVENSRSRTNVALGLTSQGFTDHCEVPSR